MLPWGLTTLRVILGKTPRPRRRHSVRQGRRVVICRVHSRHGECRPDLALRVRRPLFGARARELKWHGVDRAKCSFKSSFEDRHRVVWTRRPKRVQRGQEIDAFLRHRPGDRRQQSECRQRHPDPAEQHAADGALKRHASEPVTQVNQLVDLGQRRVNDDHTSRLRRHVAVLTESDPHGRRQERRCVVDAVADKHRLRLRRFLADDVDFFLR